MAKKKAAPKPSKPVEERVRLVCTKETRVGGPHRLPGDELTVSVAEAEALLASGAYARA